MKYVVDDYLLLGYLRNTINREDRDLVEEWIMLTPENRRHFIELDSSNDAIKIDKSHFDAIDVDRGYQRVIKGQGRRSLSYRDVLMVWQRVAAVVVIPLIIAFASYVAFDWGSSEAYLPRDEEEQVWQEIISPNGARVNIDLPDGTKVVLNANSRLRFPTIFSYGDREVELNGEAYFDVVSDKENPFKVKCAKETITATGTAFNVEAYAWDTLSIVVLERGVIDVDYHGEFKSIRLMPNERLTRSLLSGNIEKEQVNAARLTAWRDGKLIFRNEKLSEIMRKIGLIYNSDVVFEDRKMMDNIYHATFENESLREILRLMKISMPIDFVDIDKKLQPDGYYTRHKIIVKKKW